MTWRKYSILTTSAIIVGWGLFIFVAIAPCPCPPCDQAVETVDTVYVSSYQKPYMEQFTTDTSINIVSGMIDYRYEVMDWYKGIDWDGGDVIKIVAGIYAVDTTDIDTTCYRKTDCGKEQQ